MFIDIPVFTENVILRLSGGADSAILMWLICNEWNKRKTPLNLYTITVVHEKRNWQSYHAQQVFDFVSEQFPDVNHLEFKSELCTDPGGTSTQPDRWSSRYVEKQTKLIYETIDKIGADVQIFNGVTSNPPKEIGEKLWGWSETFKDIWECREKHRDWENRHNQKLIDHGMMDGINQWYCNPFGQSHKEHVIRIYRRHNLIDTLLPLTRSCEGWDYITDGFTKECGQCWWCKEREWALNV